jgi:hypothetical protein
MSVKSQRLFLVRRCKVSPARSRLFIGDYIVDLHERNDVTYYAISRHGSDDILSIGHELTYAEAEQSARWTINQLDPFTLNLFSDEQSA